MSWLTQLIVLVPGVSLGFLMMFLLQHYESLPTYADHFSSSERWRMRAWMLTRKSSYIILEMMRRLGMTPNINASRAVIEWTFGWPESDDALIKSRNQVLNGVPVRIYKPVSAHTKGAALMFIHGGGWSSMSINTHDKVVRTMVRELGITAVSVDYRRTPEHIFPAQLDDCVTVIKYMMHNASALDIDPSRIAVGGDSAGGYLTAVLTMKWRQLLNEQKTAASNISTSKENSVAPTAKLHPIKLQIIIYGVFQMVNFSTVSWCVNRNDPFLLKLPSVRACLMLHFGPKVSGNLTLLRAFYANNHTTKRTREELAPFFELPKDGEPDADIVGAAQLEEAARVRLDRTEFNPDGDPELESKYLTSLRNEIGSPLLATSFHQIPNAFIVTCGHDILRDDGILYARRLRKSGQVPIVEHHHYPNKYHVWLNMDPEPIVRDLQLFLERNPDAL